VGVFVGLLAGAGLFCVWWSCWVPTGTPDPVRPAPAIRARELLVQAGLPSVSPHLLALTCLGFGCTVFLAVFALSTVITIAACFGLMAAWLPISLVVARARRRRERWRDLWPDVVDNLGSGVRAGLSLPEALGQIGQRGPEPLRASFAAFAQDYRLTGNFAEALDALKDRLADPVADRLCEALRIAREVGGSDLGRLLRGLSAFLREDARTRSELEARQSWTLNAARLASSVQ
jgi:tight adherence protein B